MISFYVIKENTTTHNLNWPYTPDHPYRIIITGGSGWGQTNALFNLIYHPEEDDSIDKIYLYAKDPYQSKYRFLINLTKSVGLVHFNNRKAFIEYSNNMQDVDKKYWWVKSRKRT